MNCILLGSWLYKHLVTKKLPPQRKQSFLLKISPLNLTKYIFTKKYSIENFILCVVT